MSKITNYAFLFQRSFGTKNSSNMVNPFKVSNLSSSPVKAQLKAAGIDTNSKQYKAAIKEMTKHPGSSRMRTNAQAIKNLMSQYDKDGDYIDPTTGMAGLVVTEKNAASRKKIISVPEESRDEIFEYAKKEFLQNNGMSEGLGRSEIYTNMQKKMNKNDRLAATHTLQQYENAYTQAFISAVKEANPGWQYGKPIPEGALDGITRESVEKQLVKSGNRLVKRSTGYGSFIDMGV